MSITTSPGITADDLALAADCDCEDCDDLTTGAAGPYAAVAAELHRIADALATLPADMPEPYVSITLSNSSSSGVDDETRMAAVDAVGLAVLGERGQLDGGLASNGKRRYGPHRQLMKPVYLSLFDTVTDPAEVSEVERLRAELAEARRQLASPPATPEGE